MRKLSVASITFTLLTYCCWGQNSYTYKKPAELGDGWKTNSLKSQKINTSGIYQLFSQLKSGKSKIHSILLIKDNQIIIEEYFNGYNDQMQHDLRSSTKSIRSILMGIAIDLGFIKNVNEPILKYLKDKVSTKNFDKAKYNITIRDLLIMSSGLDCNDWDKKSKGQEDKVYKKKDWLKYTLNLPMVNKPGKEANYCSMGAILVAEIISQASGMSIEEFAYRYLFKPLNITNVSWGHTLNKEVIPSGKRLYMTSRDMAKIGQLILDKGLRNGKQVVSEKWVKESTISKTKITGMDYSFFWWSIPFKVNNQTIHSITATGNGGQYIMVLPKLEMIAVFTGGAYNSQEDKLPFAIMRKVFLPAFINSK